MTDFRPEITVRADGAFVVVDIKFNSSIPWNAISIPFSVEEADDLACRFKEAVGKASPGYYKPETWRDRESML